MHPIVLLAFGRFAFRRRSRWEKWTDRGRMNRSFAFRGWLSIGLLSLIGGVPTGIEAGSVQLKNGMVLNGKPSRLISLTRNPEASQGPTTIYHIVVVSTGWQRYYVPMRQVAPEGLNFDVDLVKPDEFAIPQLKRNRSDVIQSVGTIISATPFDAQFGRRTLQLATPRGPIAVVQGITRITPDHVDVSGLTHVWEYGLGLSTLPQETIVSILHNPIVCKPDQPQDRLGRARFYVQANWYPEAFAELDSIAADFPDLKDRVAATREGLLQEFGRHVLRELQRRRDAGQYELADASVTKLPRQLLGGAVQREVQKFLDASDQERDDVDRSRTLLGELQARLGDAKLVERVMPLRAQLAAELNRAGMDRLRPFLQAEADPQLAPEEKLALAYSGWVLGSDAADTNLEQAVHLWEARDLIREYLRTPNPVERSEQFEAIRKLEGVGPSAIRRMLQNMAPPLDAEMVKPGVPTRITPEAIGDQATADYAVVLPPEYTPLRRYPCIVALRPQHRDEVETAEFWAGNAESPGWAQRRGYIVVSPVYMKSDQRDYTFGAAAHAAVLAALRDARLRFSIDADRVFLAGQEMGGDAAFDMGLSHPDEFAGVIPIGGVCDHYGVFSLDNGQMTKWYVVRGELGRDSTTVPMTELLDRMFVKGAKFDMIYVQYVGRGFDAYADELPRLFDWMDTLRRGPPPAEFRYETLRQSDDRQQWITAAGLPRNYILPQPSGGARGIDVMSIEGRVTEGNTIYVKSPAPRNFIRLYEGLVDFEKKVTVRVNARSKFSQFVAPDTRTLLEDFRLNGDRSRIAAVVLEI